MQTMSFNGWTVNYAVKATHYFFDVHHPDGVYKGACYSHAEMLQTLEDIKTNGLKSKPKSEDRIYGIA